MIMGFRATGQEAKVTPKSRPTTPDLGASWVRTPPTLLLVRSSWLRGRQSGLRVPSNGPKINRGMAVLQPNNENVSQGIDLD